MDRQSPTLLPLPFCPSARSNPGNEGGPDPPAIRIKHLFHFRYRPPSFKSKIAKTPGPSIGLTAGVGELVSSFGNQAAQDAADSLPTGPMEAAGKASGIEGAAEKGAVVDGMFGMSQADNLFDAMKSALDTMQAEKAATSSGGGNDTPKTDTDPNVYKPGDPNDPNNRDKDKGCHK